MSDKFKQQFLGGLQTELGLNGLNINDYFKESEIGEKWSQKYKNSIDCTNPKGFSQKAHCQGKKKNKVSEEKLNGGKSDKKTIRDLVKKHKTNSDLIKKQLIKGIKVEMEHTKDKKVAQEIAMDHIYEDPKYYDKLKKIENKEATGSGSAGGFVAPIGFDPNSNFVKRSFEETPKKIETIEATGAGAGVGAYETPSMWAKSTSKSDWRGKSKTQIPGGKFVQVKKKCKKFPYCNQGDINALKLTDSQVLERVIKNVSKRTNLSEGIILDIISEYIS